MRVLLTGAGGFLGRATRKALRGHAVHAVDSAGGHSIESLDLLDPDMGSRLPEALDAAIHLAAVSSDSACREDPLLAWQVNLMATLRLFEECSARGCRHFVLASSEWVYGDGTGIEPHSEFERLSIDGLGTYAASKLACECALRQMQKQDNSLLVARFGILYGPRTSGLSAVESIALAVADNLPVEVHSGKTARCYLHVEDAAEGLRLALEARLCGTFNFAGDDLISLRDVYKASCVASGMAPEFTEKAADRWTIRNLDSTLLRSQLPWRPARFTERLAELLHTREEWRPHDP